MQHWVSCPTHKYTSQQSITQDGPLSYCKWLPNEWSHILFINRMSHLVATPVIAYIPECIHSCTSRTGVHVHRIWVRYHKAPVLESILLVALHVIRNDLFKNAPVHLVRSHIFEESLPSIGACMSKSTLTYVSIRKVVLIKWKTVFTFVGTAGNKVRASKCSADQIYSSQSGRQSLQTVHISYSFIWLWSAFV